MANEVIPIVTKLTLVALSGLVTANQLEEGLQYLVTDKDWLLLATGNNTLISVSGLLTIQNGFVLPSYIVTDILRIDFGIIDYDISTDTGNPITIVPIDGYYPMKAEFEYTGISGMCTIYPFSMFLTEPIDIGPEIYVFYPITNINNFVIATTFGTSVFTASYEIGGSYRLIIEFKKSLLY